MSFCHSGMNGVIVDSNITLKISSEHPLIKLANTLDWNAITKIVLPDLKNTTRKRFWWLGRRLKLRIHLGVFLLQQLLNATEPPPAKNLNKPKFATSD